MSDNNNNLKENNNSNNFNKTHNKIKDTINTKPKHKNIIPLKKTSSTIKTYRQKFIIINDICRNNIFITLFI